MSFARVDQIQDKNGDHAINVADIVSASKLTTETDKKLNLTGGTLTGPLIASRAPQSDLEVGTKKYVDDKVLAAIPAGTGHAYETLRAGASGALEYFDGGQKIGDVLFTTRTPNSSYVLPDTIYTRAAYPALFALVGTQGEKNDGSNFSSVAHGLSSTATYTAIACGKDNVMIVVGNVSGGSNSSTGSYAGRSVDGGLTWSPITSLNGTVYTLGTIQTDENGVWVAGSLVTALVYRSTDNGLTWSAGISTPGVTAPRSMATDKVGTWIVSYNDNTQTTISRSSDNGLTWSSISSPDRSGVITHDGVATWYTAVNGGGSLYKSINSGTTWFYVVGSASVYAPVSGGGVSIFFALGLGHFISSDGGLMWKLFPLTAISSSTNSYVDRNGVIYIQQFGKMYKSYDLGETWTITTQTQINFTPSVQLNSLVSDSNGNWVVLFSSTAFLRSTRLFNYDTSTQFKVPPIKAPKGYKAYIKAKLGAEA